MQIFLSLSQVKVKFESSYLVFLFSKQRHVIRAGVAETCYAEFKKYMRENSYYLRSCLSKIVDLNA